MIKKFISASLLFTLLSLLASGLNFLFYPVVVRVLTLSEFGDVQLGISFIMQAAALFTSLNVLTMYLTAHVGANSKFTSILERFVISTSAILALIVVLFAKPISDWLQINDPSILYLVSVIFMINIPASTWLGTLQGNGQFVASGVAAASSAAIKIIAGLALTYLGLGSYGALLGILLGTAALLPLTFFLQNRPVIDPRRTFRFIRQSDLILLKNNKFVLLSFLSIFFLGITSTLDVIASKILLEPDQAGIYAQISTAAKIPFFIVAPLTVIFFERLIKDSATIASALKQVAAVVIVSAGGVILCENVIMGLLFGTHEYSESAYNYAVVAFSLYSLLTLVLYILISRGRYIQAFSLGIITVLIPTIFFQYATGAPDQISMIYMLAQFFSLSIGFVLQYTYSND